MNAVKIFRENSIDTIIILKSIFEINPKITVKSIIVVNMNEPISYTNSGTYFDEYISI